MGRPAAGDMCGTIAPVMHRPFVSARAALVAWLVLAGAALPVAQPRPSIILATTTSTLDSGLLDALVPRFEKERAIEVKTIAVGTGAALRMAATGNADVVLVHAPASERPYVDAGDLIDGRLVMHNDFILVGPADDPAGVHRQRTIADAAAWWSRAR